MIWSWSVEEYGLSEDLQVIMEHLSQEQFPIPSDFVADQVKQGGAGRLEMLESWGILNRHGMTSIGTEALLTAARFENYEAVTWLLQAGVDVNAQITIGHQTSTVIGSCFKIGSEGARKVSLGMCQYLVNSGAELRLRHSDETCYDLLRTALFYSGQAEDWATFDFFQRFPNELERITRKQWNELIRRMTSYGHWPRRQRVDWTFFEYLLDQYFTREEGPILTGAIVADCPPKIISLLLEHGADVDEDDPLVETPLSAAIMVRRFDVARQLIRLEADMDGSREDWPSALCNACFLESSSTAEQHEKLDLIRFMIANGADVNGTSRSHTISSSPLQVCAESGDLDVASLLLQHQADPNVLVWHFRRSEMRSEPVCWTALDTAVASSRLDLTQLLLKSGALSGEPGSTGYDGALEQARSRGFSTIELLICRHISQNEEQFEQCPALRVHHQAMMNRVRAAATSPPLPPDLD